MTRPVDFTVLGEEKIHCAGCEERIGDELRELPGVHDVRASAQTQHVVVMIDSTEVAPEQIRVKLAQLGYQVTLQEGLG